MGCTECSSSRGEQVKIEYITGHTEKIELCADCRAAFEEGEFVRDVSRVDE